MQKLMYRQTGSVLFISLVMLLLMTLIGVSAMQSTNLEEKMASNSRNRSLAFQAAETALRDAEWLIRCNVRSSADESTFIDRFGSACTDGLCASDDRNLTFIDAYWRDANWDGRGTRAVRSLGLNGSDPAAVCVAAGSDADLAAAAPRDVPSVSQVPDYLIEANRGLYAGLPDSSYLYRVTARGYGADTADKTEPRSRATLQEIYRPIK